LTRFAGPGILAAAAAPVDEGWEFDDEAPQAKAVQLELIRPDDLVNLEVEAVNLRVRDGSPPTLVVADQHVAAFLIVRFPPQSITETAYFEWRNDKLAAEADPPARPDPDATSSGSAPLDPPGVPGTRDATSSAAHGSRLVFELLADVEIPLTIEGLLDWSAFAPKVSALAAVPAQPTAEEIASAPAIAAPAVDETALELPYRLVISPNGDVRWGNRAQRFTSNGRTELWHSRLMRLAADGPAELSHTDPAPLRAIWSPDYGPVPMVPPHPHLGRTAMDDDDRRQIVVLTSAFHGWESTEDLVLPLLVNGKDMKLHLPFTERYVPQPFEAELLLLSSLGGWLRSIGRWNPPSRAKPSRRDGPDVHRIFARPLRDLPAELAAPDAIRERVPLPPGDGLPDDLDLSEWVHVAAQGRDHYVRIVYDGALRSFGHKVSLVKVTERKFEDEVNRVGAYLMQRMFIVVREHVKTYAADDRGMPYKRVEITTTVTPDIAPPQIISGSHRSFWVEVMSGSQPVPFQFHCVGTDVNGETTDFTTPLMFVSRTDASDANVVKAYNDSSTPAQLAFRDASLSGQKLGFAERAGNENTELVVDKLNFVVDPTTLGPKLLYADVRIPQVQQLAGNDTGTTIQLLPSYVSSGFDGGAQVFGQVATVVGAADPANAVQPQTFDVKFQAQNAGGLATPNLGVSILSRVHGPLAGTAAQAQNGTFDASSFFGSAFAFLFGTFDLAQLIDGDSLDTNAPKLTTTTTDGGNTVTTAIDWNPNLKPADAGGVAKFSPHGTLTIKGTITKHLDPAGAAQPPTVDINGTLNDFDVSILNSLTVHFQAFSFTAVSGRKPTVDVQLKTAPTPLEFSGDLNFVNDLRNAIPPGVFGDGPSLDLVANPAGIRAGFAIALPPLAVGVFALKDVALGAALTLPFTDGKPVVDFNVSRRDHPFLVAVAIFGGGGFFHLQLDTAGMKELEAAIEFGATASLDIGVASGGVHVMAGIYFSLQRRDLGGKMEATLTGYLRMGGSLSVLGLVTVSVEFNLSFTYQSETNKAYGRATLTVEVEVVCFSKSVELTVERAFGGEGDPSFRQAFSTPETWSGYALAFA
jgi:hypothetical protein